MSGTVGKALLLTGGPEVEETAKFVLMFNKFFDVLNVTNFTNGTRYRNPDIHPYRHKDDDRLLVSAYNIIVINSVYFLK